MLAHDPHSHRHKGKPINRYNEHMHIQEKFTKEEGVHAYVCMWRVARDKQMSPRACNLCEILLLPHVWYKIWRVSEREREVGPCCSDSASMMRSCSYWWCWRFALIALGKEPKCVNLLDKVGHAGPATEPKSNH